MKFFFLLISILLLGCNSKEEQPELDYVKIDIVPIQHYISSSITIDFKSKIITFSDLSQLEIIPEDCAFTLDKFGPNVEFSFIRLNQEEFDDLSNMFNLSFLKSLEQNNKSQIETFDESTLYRIDIVSSKKIFSTEDFLTIEQSDEVKIEKVLKLIRKYSTADFNKKYIDRQLYLTE